MKGIYIRIIDSCKSEIAGFRIKQDCQYQSFWCSDCALLRNHRCKSVVYSFSWRFAINIYPIWMTDFTKSGEISKKISIFLNLI